MVQISIYIIGSRDRIDFVKNNMPPAAEMGEAGSNDLSDARSCDDAMSAVKSFYNIDGILGHWVRRYFNRVRDKTSGRVVVVCDDALSHASDQFLSELVHEFDGIPSMFVLMGAGLSKNDILSRRAKRAGFDNFLDFADVRKFPDMASRHFEIIKRNRPELRSVVKGGLLAIVATLLFVFVSTLTAELARSIYGYFSGAE